MKSPKSKVQSPKPGVSITSIESLDMHTCEIIRLRAFRAERFAQMEARIAAIQQEYAKPIGDLSDNISAREEAVTAYCLTHRAELFAEKKSRETLTAVIGFEWTPYRVETTGRKVTWKVVVQSLLGLVWGKDYVRHPEPQPDKDALLRDREKLTTDQLERAGICFARDDQFFIRGKEVAP
ncbi:MAG TPA: host-nuclease inhibitor Gam family protein [Verrucomicrobiae bacterium]|jgi:phage host-nuclease inhibitor protein Gam|nr:host-nuclease inhibitor Gam family protein [Verrucomicrobiae bacterium]